MMYQTKKPSPSGHFSPLRYPGGKGKLAQFIINVIRQNGLSDGLYVEPYAGGAAVAWELLLKGVVRRISINDINKPVYYFWQSVVNNTLELIDLINSTPVDLENRDRLRHVFRDPSASPIMIGFAMFYLNRTQRSGILNGGVIGGRDQLGKWKIDARFNKSDLIKRILAISAMKSRITISNMDAVCFLKYNMWSWPTKTLVYLDPPYYEKGRDLYYDFYKHDDHVNISCAVRNIKDISWIVSYDDISPIHSLYEDEQWLQYTIGYSAREKMNGREAMFFSENLDIPPVVGSMRELSRGVFVEHEQQQKSFSF